MTTQITAGTDAEQKAQPKNVIQLFPAAGTSAAANSGSKPAGCRLGAATRPEENPGCRCSCRRRGPELERVGERGMATAEYAITTLAAVGFAGLLVVILRSDEVRGFLLSIIRGALSLG